MKTKLKLILSLTLLSTYFLAHAMENTAYRAQAHDANIRSITNDSSDTVKIVYHTLMGRPEIVEVPANSKFGLSQLNNFGIAGMMPMTYLEIKTNNGEYHINSASRCFAKHGAPLVFKKIALSNNDRKIIDQLLIFPTGSFDDVKPLFDIVVDNNGRVAFNRCAVCFDEGSQALPTCGHSLCVACMANGELTACPLCRGQYSQPALLYLEAVNAGLDVSEILSLTWEEIHNS